MVRRPKEPLAQAQRINNVPDEDDRVRVDGEQKICQLRGACAPEAQMDVGQE